MGVQDWNLSGQGRDVGPIALSDAHILAIKAGFVFTDNQGVPAQKRANLQAMFDWADVTSLSLFKEKFYNYRMTPPGGDLEDSGARKGCIQAASTSEWKRLEYTYEDGHTCVYVGCTKDGRPHGYGMMRRQGVLGSIVHIGRFEEGKQTGCGGIFTPRGEQFHGNFKDGIMWGPGVYTFPSIDTQRDGSSTDADSGSGGSHQSKTARVQFKGMHNGMPHGLGSMTWSDGKVELGRFMGADMVAAASMDECQGVLLVAEQHAEFAKRVIAEAVEDIRSHGNIWKSYNEEILEGLPYRF